jgi:hypothetical protein
MFYTYEPFQSFFRVIKMGKNVKRITYNVKRPSVFQGIAEEGVFQRQPDQHKQNGPFEVYLVEVLGVAETGFLDLGFFQLVYFAEYVAQRVLVRGPVKGAVGRLGDLSQVGFIEPGLDVAQRGGPFGLVRNAAIPADADGVDLDIKPVGQPGGRQRV